MAAVARDGDSSVFRLRQCGERPFPECFALAATFETDYVFRLHMRSDAPWKLIFVGGIHGVGKGTFCRQAAMKFDAQHLSAGELIAEAKKAASLDKTVADVSDNQSALVAALRAKISDGRPVLLDGHFCLLRPDYSIQEIGVSTFRALHPHAVVVVVDEPATIKDRLFQRDNRDYDLQLLVAFQERETAWAERVAAELAIPYRAVHLSTGGTDAADIFRSVGID